MNQYRKALEQLKGKRAQIQSSLDRDQQTLITCTRDMKRWERAREIIKLVGIKTQERLQYHISNITSLALETVFDEPYELKVEFVQRRNQTECDIFFERDGERFDPMASTGGGAVDVAALALRIACWSMMAPKSRNTLLLDEPLRFLSADLQSRASQMLKELSRKLNLQMIIVSHNDAIIDEADKIFRVKMKKGISHVET